MAAAGFDLNEYISQYAAGGLKIQRLLLIARTAEAAGLATAAREEAIAEIKKTLAIKTYLEVMDPASGGKNVGCDEDNIDQEWVKQTKDRASSELSVLEHRFGVANTGGRYDEKREALRELGRHYRSRGDSCTALKYFFRMRDCSSRPMDVVDMYLEIIAVGVEGRSSSLNQHCARAEQNGAARDKVAIGKVRVAQGLFLLDSGKYKPAARKFLSIPPELGDEFNEVLTARDIATFALLLGLATLTREEIKAKFIDTTPFRAYLELAPELMQVVTGFYDSQYQSLKLLDALRERLSLDYFLRSHVGALYEIIKQRALKQYTTPYVSVDLNRMAAAFAMPRDQLQEALVQIIVKGDIAARIDSAAGVLHMRSSNVVRQTFEDTLAVGRQLIVDTQDNLRRISMCHTRFEYKRGATEGGDEGGEEYLTSMNMPYLGAGQQAGWK